MHKKLTNLKNINVKNNSPDEVLEIEIELNSELGPKNYLSVEICGEFFLKSHIVGKLESCPILMPVSQKNIKLLVRLPPQIPPSFETFLCKIEYFIVFKEFKDTVNVYKYPFRVLNSINCLLKNELKEVEKNILIKKDDFAIFSDKNELTVFVEKLRNKELDSLSKEEKLKEFNNLKDYFCKNRQNYIKPNLLNIEYAEYKKIELKDGKDRIVVEYPQLFRSKNNKISLTFYCDIKNTEISISKVETLGILRFEDFIFLKEFKTENFFEKSLKIDIEIPENKKHLNSKNYKHVYFLNVNFDEKTQNIPIFVI